MLSGSFWALRHRYWNRHHNDVRKCVMNVLLPACDCPDTHMSGSNGTKCVCHCSSITAHTQAEVHPTCSHTSCRPCTASATPARQHAACSTKSSKFSPLDAPCASALPAHAAPKLSFPQYGTLRGRLRLTLPRIAVLRCRRSMRRRDRSARFSASGTADSVAMPSARYLQPVGQHGLNDGPPFPGLRQMQVAL